MRQYILIAAISFLLTSCYSDYVHLKRKTTHYPSSVFQFGDSNLIAFVSTQEAYLRAKGITAFPDGGQSKVIYEETGLYIFDMKNNKLTQLKDLTDSSILPWYVKNRAELLFIDSLVYYYRKVQVLDVEDAKDHSLLKQKYEKCFSVNINTKEVNLIDTAKFNSLYQKYHKKYTLSALNKELKKIPLSEFGLVIQDIYPKSDKKYIKEVIYLKNDGKTTRRAVIEQIISKLNKKKIKDLLRKMDEYKNSLKGLEKTEYEIYSKETYEDIQELL